MVARADTLAAVDSRWALFFILALAAVVRLAIWSQTPALLPHIVDEQHYYRLAQSLHFGFGFAWGPEHETSIRPPLYPYFMNAVWTLTGGVSLQAVRLVQIVLSLCTIALVYWLARLAFHERIALLAAGLYAFYPTLIAYDSLLLTEVVFNFLVTAVAVVFLLLTRGGRWWLALMLGGLLGLAALTRSAAWPFMLPLTLLILVFVPGAVVRRLGLAALLVVGFAVTVTPWAMRNSELQGQPVMIDTMGGLNLFMGNYEHTPLHRSWAAIGLRGEEYWAEQMWREAPESRQGWTEAQRDAWAKGAAVEFIKEHPWLTLRRSAVKLMDFFGLEREILAGFQKGFFAAPGWFVVLIAALSALTWIAISIGGVMGLGGTANRAPAAVWYAFAFAATLAGIHTLVFGHSRYHLPLIPFMCTFAAAAFSLRIWREWNLRAARYVLASLAVLGLLFSWSYAVVVNDASRISDFLDSLL